MTCNAYCIKQPSLNYIKADMKANSRIAKQRKDSNEDNSNKRYTLMTDLKLLSAKLSHQHVICKRQSRENEMNDSNPHLKSRKRPRAASSLGNERSKSKKLLCKSPSMPRGFALRGNQSEVTSPQMKNDRSLKLFYTSNDSRQDDLVKFVMNKRRDNCSSVIGSHMIKNQSKLFHRRNEELKSQKQITDVRKCHKTNFKEKQVIDYITPKIRQKMKAYFLIKNQSQKGLKAKACQVEDKKECKAHVPLLWQLTFQRNQSAKNLALPLNKHQSPIKCKYISPLDQNSKEVFSMNDNSRFKSFTLEMNKGINVASVAVDAFNEDEANVIVTTINNQYDNKPFSSNSIPIYASKRIFTPKAKEASPLCFLSSCSQAYIEYLSIGDILSLSSVSKGFTNSTKRIRYAIIKSKVLSPTVDKEIHDSIWNQLMKYSKLGSEYPLKTTFITNALRESRYLFQIQKDIIRTYPNDTLFNKESLTYNQLLFILNAYANYNPSIGYSQGMNFITAKILEKVKEEEKTFLILDAIMERLHMSRIIGVSNDISLAMNSIGQLIQQNVPKFNQFLSEHMLTHELCTANWVLTLFSNSIPPKELYIIWEFIFIFGWEFFSFFVLAIIETFQETITALSFDDFSDQMKLLLYSDSFTKQFELVIDLCFKYMQEHS